MGVAAGSAGMITMGVNATAQAINKGITNVDFRETYTQGLKSAATSAVTVGITNVATRGMSSGFGRYKAPKDPTVKVESNPLEGIEYSEKVVDQMKKDLYHGFPRMIDNFGAYGRQSIITGNDGIKRLMVEIPGSINNKEGVFQYIIGPDKMCNHRLFKIN